MAVRIRRARPSSDGSAPDEHARQDNLLALLDQAFYDGHRATGQNEAMQALWVYEHPIDLDAVRRLHRNLGRGLFVRRIERSPLPFGRHRWVSVSRPPDLEIAASARPRAELSDWADERLQLPVNPEDGPGWHLAVQPFTDGSTAVSIVVSHYVMDGIGSMIEFGNALLGNTRDLGYPPSRSRTRLRAVVHDVRQTARDAPAVGRTLAAVAKLARDQRHKTDQPSPAPRPGSLRASDGDARVFMPGIAIYIDLNEWDARATALGGSSNTLAAALAAKFGERLGFRHDDGTVTVQLVVSDRTENDTRAVAVSFTRVSVDPTQVTTDLGDARVAIKEALKTLRETTDESTQLAPMTPLTPQGTWKRLVDGALTDPAHPVVCSNFGDVPLVTRLDGTESEYMYARAINQHMTRQLLERMGGQLQLLSYRSPTKFTISLLAYQPGAENTKPALRELAARTLAEFGITGKID